MLIVKVSLFLIFLFFFTGFVFSQEKELTITEVHRLVLNYNEVSPDKIKQWRIALKFRGLFPKVSLSYDNNVAMSSNPNYKECVVGPLDWGVSFSWDLDELVWNSCEDDVDRRNRAMTQMRLNILEEVNEIYFKRLRLKHWLEKESLSEEEKFQKETEFEELTAMLDGYTGGAFSRYMRKEE